MSWFDRPSMQQWARHIRDDVAEKIKDSYATCSIVPSDGEPQVRYLREPFTGSEDAYFDVTSVNYTWNKLFDRAEAPA